jgi:hypothetical protein
VVLELPLSFFVRMCHHGVGYATPVDKTPATPSRANPRETNMGGPTPEEEAWVDHHDEVAPHEHTNYE